MRSLAGEEYSELVSKLSSIAQETFPALLVPPSETAELSAMVEIKAGVGGSEAALFVGDMVRMYTAAAGHLGWKAVLVSSNVTENGGSKEAMLEVKGEKAYDTLRWETGVHRVQRVPATEASGRVHTSTVTVLVLPLEEDNGQEVKDDLFTMDEIKLEVMRSRGAGGQHVNKTESAVRLTHIPTGITVSMQDERSQHQNRRKAFQVLRARLMDRKIIREMTDRRDMRRSLVKGADRSEKVRTYNYTQDRVTDHRLGMSIMNIDSVMEGDALQEFLVGLGRKHQEDLLEEAAHS
ncbi:release factor [Trametopsis cervina]|nr:release factor [Trametopsis cervina]